MRQKRAVWPWVLATIVAVLVSGLILFISLKAESTQRHQAYLDEMRALPGVAHVQYEIQHPGVPWNNAVIVLAAIDFRNEAAAAALITEMIEITESAELMDHYTTEVYLADSSSTYEDQLTDRRTYFSRDSLPEGIRELLGDGYTGLYTSVRRVGS